MFSHFYQKNIIEKPKIIFAILLLCLASFGFFAKDFRLDASSETLLIDGDPDLKYLREITERYNSKEFLVLTYAPNEDMVSENSINNLLSLKYKIQSLEWIDSVVTILDIPLLNSPVFRNFVISEDGKTSGIIVNIKKNEIPKEYKSKKEIEKHIKKITPIHQSYLVI